MRRMLVGISIHCTYKEFESFIIEPLTRERHVFLY